jgi:hypothetical protein
MYYYKLIAVLFIFIAIVIFCYFKSQEYISENLTVDLPDNFNKLTITRNDTNTQDTNKFPSPSPCTGKGDCAMCKDTNTMPQCPKCGKTKENKTSPMWSSSNLDDDGDNFVWNDSNKLLDGVGPSELCSFAKVSFEPSTQDEKEQMRLNPAFMNLGTAR